MKNSLYDSYLKLKKENIDNMYLFKVGLFYIFLDEDAKNISKITTLKLINHTKDVVKCGFPENSLDKYLDIFCNLGINVVVVDDNFYNNFDSRLFDYLNKIKKLDINSLTPIRCMEILSKLKDLL